MGCKSLVIMTVGPYIGRNPAEEREGHAFVHIISLIRIVKCYLLVGMAGVCVERPNSELNLMAGGRIKDSQRNVNLSPGAAPATSRFSSRIYSGGPSQS
jgi:hypothetical protein